MAVATRIDTVKLSQKLFRISFVAFAAIYLVILSEFISPQQLNMHFDINKEALLITSLVIACFYVFLRKPKL